MAGGAGLTLLERDEALAILDAALADLVGGTSGFVIVDGAAGIGKSALVDELVARARRAGITVASGAATPLESDLAYGVVRQLFEPLLAAADEQARRRLVGGAAELARPVLEIFPAAAPAVAPPGAAADRSLSVAHGLYWLTANVAEAGPVAIVIDDAQWCDAPSMRFLAYLARRLKGLPVLLVVALRSGEEPTDPESLAALTAPGAAVPIRPDPLSEDAVAVLAEQLLGPRPAAEFVAACRAATGGVPFLVHELLKALAADGVEPKAEAAARVFGFSPDTVAHATLLRLSQLGGPAVAVTRTVAVLDRHAEGRLVAELADLPQTEVLTQADRLAAAHILSADRPLRFAHPILAAAVYDELGLGARSVAHAAAARMLERDGADPEEVAAHLLKSEPAADPATVAALLRAADVAGSRAAPTSSVTYLRRALAEPPADAARIDVVHRLGRAESEVGDPQAVPHLEDALRRSGQGSAAVAVAADLVGCHLFAGRWQQALECATSVPPIDDGATRTLVELLLAGLSAYDVRAVAYFDARLSVLEQLARADDPAARGLALLLASVSASRIDDSDVTPTVVRDALAPGLPALAEATMPQALWALLYGDHLDAADDVVAMMRDEGRRRGSVLATVCALMMDTEVLTRRGDLRMAEAQFAGCAEMAMEHRLLFALPALLGRGLDALLERPGLDPFRSLTEIPDLEQAFDLTGAGALVFDARGAVRLADGRTGEGIADLRRCGELLGAMGITNPAYSRWRPRLALALAATDREEALELAAAELAAARATGLPRLIGVALHSAGLVEGGDPGLAMLEESVEVLAGAGHAPLEQARSHTDLGGALRRSGQRAAAREPLRIGLSLAERCGAQRLADRAEDELRLAGAKPRRRAADGVDSLTPGEARVARLAAGGMSTREIAEALFVSSRTVENQLGAVYRKLGIAGRSELAAAMAADTWAGP